LVKIEGGQGVGMGREEREIAHLALGSSEVAPITAEYDGLLEDLLKNGVMKSLCLPRGK
jgi:hypothetical protein